MRTDTRMMVSPTELRIGNWMTLDDGVSAEFCQITGYDLSRSDVNGVYHNPIHLTSELLQKCGFVLDKGVGVWFDNKDYDGFRFTIWDDVHEDYKYTRQSPSDTIALRYIHQLQNLYFALTGEELTINLLHDQP